MSEIKSVSMQIKIPTIAITNTRGAKMYILKQDRIKYHILTSLF
jgi:hypothetical protein